MKFIEIAVILLILFSSSVKSNEIKGKMEITILVTLSTLPFAVNDYPVIHTLANTIYQFIFGNMPVKIHEKMKGHNQHELTIQGSMKLDFRRSNEQKSDTAQANIVYGSQVFSSSSSGASAFSVVSSSSTVTSLEEQSLSDTAAAGANIITFNFNVPFIAGFDNNGELYVGINTDLKKISDELQKQMMEHVD